MASTCERRELLKKIFLLELSEEDDVATIAVAANSLGAAVAMHQSESNPGAHVQNFVENVVPHYTGAQFKGHFRMTPGVFEIFCGWLAPHLPPHRTVSTERKLLATLWLLATQETYRSVADRFGMNRGTLHRIVKRVCRALVSLRGDVIKWPVRRQEMQRIVERFQAKSGFPGVVGAIDGTYIKILGKSDETRDSYICRKGFPAMQLQVVCSSDLLFLDVETGNVGSVHDSRVFRNSSLCGRLESDEGQLPPEYHLIGDSAYPLRDYLMVPYRDNGHLTTIQTGFNSAHSKTRVDVERAIGLLKGKFRRLKSLEMTNTLELPQTIFSCCVIHNFIILQSGVDVDDIDLPERDDVDVAADEHQRRLPASCIHKRNDIALALA